jgi:glycerophosphoryl diester phosphodiesterase
MIFRFLNTQEELIDRVILTDEMATPLRIIAHRGASAYAPENTLPAFEKARALGVPDVELDVQLSRDGHLVLFHDKRLDEKTNRVGTVNQYTVEELLRTDIGSWFDRTRRPPGGERYAETTLISLEQLLSAFGAELFYHIEIKGTEKAIPAKLVTMLRDKQLEGQVIVTSQDKGQLVRVRKLSERVGVCYLLQPNDPPSLPQEIQVAKALGFTQVGVRAKALTPEVVRAAKATGLGIRGYSVRSFADIDKIIRVGAEGTTVDWPDLLWMRILNSLNDQECPIWRQDHWASCKPPHT